MYTNENKSSGSFPDPLASQKVKESKAYGLKYDKDI